MSESFKGIVKWFNDAKGFGFIEHETGDVFVHFSSIESAGFKTLKNGEEVEYSLEAGDKGLHAKKVLRISVPNEEIAQDPASPKREANKSKGLASQIEVERIADEVDADNDGSLHPTTSDAPMTNNQNSALLSKKL